MERKLSDKAGAEAWIQEAQGTDWSKGRESRLGVFQTVLSKNPYMGQKGAQKATEDIEKFFFANQEMLQKRGFSPPRTWPPESQHLSYQAKTPASSRTSSGWVLTT